MPPEAVLFGKVHLRFRLPNGGRVKLLRDCAWHSLTHRIHGTIVKFTDLQMVEFYGKMYIVVTIQSSHGSVMGKNKSWAFLLCTIIPI